MNNYVFSLNKCTLYIVCALCFFLVSCRSGNTPSAPNEVPQPHWKVSSLGQADPPAWHLEDADAEPLSMTVYTLYNPAADRFYEGDCMAAISLNDECLGICDLCELQYMYMYVQKPQRGSNEFRLCLYSSHAHQYFVSDTTYTFRNDTQLGMIGAPLNVRWRCTGAYPYLARVIVIISDHFSAKAPNELAVFVGDECRHAWSPDTDQTIVSNDGTWMAIELNVPLHQIEEEVEIRYYDGASHNIFSEKILLNTGMEQISCPTAKQ